jgi:hypothetical protein
LTEKAGRFLTGLTQWHIHWPDSPAAARYVTICSTRFLPAGQKSGRNSSKKSAVKEPCGGDRVTPVIERQLMPLGSAIIKNSRRNLPLPVVA